MSTKYTYRNIAQVIVEAASPLMVGSGEKSAETDAKVLLDANGLPMIPGTSISGVLRHMAADEGLYGSAEISSLFGNKDSDEERGSKVTISEARMIGEDGRPVDGLRSLPASEFYEMFRFLPVRHHARISGKGAVDAEGKYDCQVVYAGTRFVFEIEIISDKADDATLDKILSLIQLKTFRIGGGTRKGYGDMQAVSVREARLDLCKPEQLALYLDKSSSFDSHWKGWKECAVAVRDSESNDCYRLELTPEDFFLFGSGHSDDEVDMTAVQEARILWGGSGPVRQHLMPASSVKGAVAHRTAFYYNQLKGRYADLEGSEPKVGSANEAVLALFGSEDDSAPKRGNVLVSDVYLEKVLSDKILNHVSIDRFTGGAIEGALFSEKVSYSCDGNPVVVEFLVDRKSYADDDDIKEAFKKALKDVATGMLPLGGGVNRGNGCFSGVLKLNGEII